VRRTADEHAMARVMEVCEETAEVRTLWLDLELASQPGQFVMVWIPGLDEKPYAVSGSAPGRIALTVRRRGPFSRRLAAMRPGEAVGVRGPYGRGFRPRPRGVMVAGGCGVAILAPLKEAMPEAPLICGARTAAEVLFSGRFPDMLVCTDDGTAGQAGLPTDLLRPILERGEADVVYTCGPEVMMHAVFKLCESYGVECQAALERYMKCGIGVCGQCSCGDRLVCRDGPVFDSSELRGMEEFGRFARLKDGRRVSVEEYAAWRSC